MDAERILTQLRLDGYDFVSGYDEADLVVVNTCGFIDSAKAESLNAIGDAIKENGRVIVTGCLGVHEGLIRGAHPGVLDVSGPQQYEQVVNAVRRYMPLPVRPDPLMDLAPDQGIKLTPRHYAYLKISEGCNHRCRFCIIPSMRGRLVSRRIDEVMQEAEGLARAGVKELLIISQDTSAYGADLKYETGCWRGGEIKSRLYDLCEALGSLGIWVRLHYVYPYPHVDEIVPLMAAGKVLPYLDIPLQHGSEKVLRSMGRPAAAEDMLTRINKWRQVCPEITIRSTFIVGFPGETEEDFALLLAFLEQAQLDRVGCFQYSPVDGARANSLPGVVCEEVKQVRWDRFMQTQQVISANKLQTKVGETIQVMVDEINDDEVVARSHADAPEIDGVVYVKSDKTLQRGQYVDVRIDGASDYDLWGQAIVQA